MNYPRILLVEDESNLRRTLTDLLKSDGYVVESSGDGLEGQELALKNPFDVIILDVMLPGMSGPDLMDRLRADHVLLPAIFVTGRLDALEMLRRRGMADVPCLQKPFEPALQDRILFRFIYGGVGDDHRSYSEKNPFALAPGGRPKE